MSTKSGIIISWLALLAGIISVFIGLRPTGQIAMMFVLVLSRQSCGLPQRSTIKEGLILIFLMTCLWLGDMQFLPKWSIMAGQIIFVSLAFAAFVSSVFYDINVLRQSTKKQAA